VLIKVRYSLQDMLLWTRREIILFTVYATLVTVLLYVLNVQFLHLPWPPVAVVGTAVAFIVGFQNSAAYERIWEARKIWGGVVNTSRTWAMQVIDMVTNEHAKQPLSPESLYHEHRVLIHRHVAWLTAFRHAMRQRKPWEEFTNDPANREWQDSMAIPEYCNPVEHDLQGLIPEEEFAVLARRKNKAATLLTLQSNHLRRLKEAGLIWEFAFLRLERLLEEMFTLQGKSERIKNFPYPRQYATLNYLFVRMFLIALPFAVVPAFIDKAQDAPSDFLSLVTVAMAIPATVAISWIYHTMERIGRVGENPFEGSANDVPISSIARGIEIDLRQMLDESPDSIPAPFPTPNHVQM